MEGLYERCKRYFACWESRDKSVLADIFADNAVYSESYGPEYIGIEQITRCFASGTGAAQILGTIK